MDATGQLADALRSGNVELKTNPVRIEYFAKTRRPGYRDAQRTRRPSDGTGHDRPARGQCTAQSRGRITAVDVRREGRSMLPGETLLTWSEQPVESNGRMDDRVVRLESRPLTATMCEAKLLEGGLSGRFEANAELGDVLCALSANSNRPTSPPLRGKLQYRGTITQAGSRWSLEGDGQIADAAWGSGETAIHDPLVKLSTSVRGSSARNRLRISQLQVISRLGTLHVKGPIDEYAGARALTSPALTRRTLAPLMTLLHQASLASRELISLQGRTSDEFHVQVLDWSAGHPSPVSGTHVATPDQLGFRRTDGHAAGSGNPPTCTGRCASAFPTPPSRWPADNSISAGRSISAAIGRCSVFPAGGRSCRTSASIRG